jgi:hypothetical protein
MIRLMHGSQRLLVSLSLAAALLNMSTLVLKHYSPAAAGASNETASAKAKCRFPRYQGLLESQKTSRSTLAAKCLDLKRTVVRVNSRCCPRAAATFLAALNPPPLVWASNSRLILQAQSIRLQV